MASAFRAVASYISAAQRIGWDVAAGYVLRVVSAEEGDRGSLPPSAARMATA